MTAPCDTCANLRPFETNHYGCEKELHTTGFWGRLWIWLFGCKGYWEKK